MAEAPGVLKRGRIIGCIITPTISKRPKPTKNAKINAPRGTIIPTGNASFSNKNGIMSFFMMMAGAMSVIYKMANINPAVLNRVNTILVIFLRHEPS